MTTSPTIEVREPLGTRSLPLPLDVGGAGANVVVPGAAAGAQLRIDLDGGRCVASAPGAARLDGRPLAGERELVDGDVLAVGDAQLLFTAARGGGHVLHVHHLAGNATIAPLAVEPLAGGDIDAADREIRVAMLPRAAAEAGDAGAAAAAAASPPSRRAFRIAWLLPLALLVAVVVAALRLAPVTVERIPAEARIETPGSFSWQAGNRLYLFPGTHRVSASADGYSPLARELRVAAGAVPAQRFVLEPLPGRLAIDTGGVAAEAFLDGARAGSAPGEIAAPAGRRTLLLRAPRHLPYTQDVDVAGRGTVQAVTAKLLPAYGTLDVSTLPAGATVLIDGIDRGVTPLRVEVDSGLRELALVSAGRKSWSTRVAVPAGETLALGPVELGAPEAQVSLASSPAGASVSVGGVARGVTPLRLALPGGVPHELAVTLPGHRAWTRRIEPRPGERLSLDAELEPVFVAVEVRGEPRGAQLLVDGQSRGALPQSLRLTATEHVLVIRADGFTEQVVRLALDAGEPRRIDYRLLPAGRDAAAPTRVEGRLAGTLRLVPAGSYVQGAGRREQGRRPNETERRVTLTRDFYLGVHEVTNAQFRAFRPKHASGIVGASTLDLDRHPVTGVTWDDAAEYCNWLSQQEGLKPAYERRDGRLQLVQPVTNGYRLPTEAEWEYAARYVDGRRFNRYAWGDALPPPAGAANLAGTETQPGAGRDASRQRTADAALPDYRDEHPVVATVGSYAANPLGLADLGGNVSEWTHDFYASFVDDADVTDPAGPATGTAHVVRGASWRSATIPELRLAWRDGAVQASQVIGFRIARHP